MQDNTLSVKYAKEAKSYLENLGVQLVTMNTMGHQINWKVIQGMIACVDEPQDFIIKNKTN